MVVAEAYRNNHIASQLLLQSEAFAKTSGIDCLYLFTETAAVFFESKGFKNNKGRSAQGITGIF